MIDESCLSTPNLAEVLGRFVRDGHDAQGILALGVSLADRACLLAKDRGIPTLTVDRSWLKADLDIDIQVIR